MKNLTRPFAFCLAIFFTIKLCAQDFSNKGKDFWVGYGYHQQMTVSSPAGGPQNMVLYFATDVVTTITVEIPRLGYSRVYPNVPANTILTSDPLPKSSGLDARLNSEGISDKGIHITSTKPIVAYTHIYNQSVSGATLLFPTNTLGKEYYSINYDQVSNVGGANCWAFAIAVDTGTTTVQVTPSAATLTHAANVPFTVNLQQGQILNLMGVINGNTGVDLTGTKIRSVSGTGAGCKRIAVFSGSGRIGLSCPNVGGSSSDNYIVQALPKTAWGKKYLTAPTQRLPNNFYRICVDDPTTVVSINGTPISGLINNFYYNYSTNEPAVIEADKPVIVAQYMTSQGTCSNENIGDPEVIYLSPVEQNIDKVILNSTNNFAITQHYINVIIRSSAVGSFKLDGINTSGAFTQHPRDPNFMFAQLQVGSGQHILAADSGFNAIAYGLGNAESYGYNAGTNVKDLYQFVSVQNPGAAVNFPSTCRGTPFYFSMTFPYQPTQIQWQFNGLFTPDVTLTNPTYDSTWVVNGKQLYRYKLPNPYVVNLPGTYPIRVVAQNPSPDGCNGTQEIDYDLEVLPQPTASFTFATNGCLSDPVQFTNTSTTGGRPIAQYNWNFGDGNTGNTANPQHTYTTSGNQIVSYSIVTDIGCISNQVTQTVNLSNSPTANFNVGASQCVNTPVTFTDASTTPSGTLIVWRWNFGDGSPPRVLGTNAPQTHTYTTPGTYTATLQVETASGCKSSITQKQIVVSGSLNVSFTFGNACLPGGAVAFTNTSGLSGAGYTYAWAFGDGGTSNIENPTHIYTGTGPYNALLIITSPNGCTGEKVQSINTIYAQPTAAFAVNKTQACQGESLSFTSNDVAPGSTASERFWIFGDGTTSTDVNPVKSYPLPGTYFVKHYFKSAIGCVSDTARETIVILPPPTASFTVSGLRCTGGPITLSSTSTTNVVGVSPSAFTWFINGVSSGTGQTFVWQPSTAGSYEVRLLINTPAGCTDDTITSIQVSPQPAPDFTLPNVCLPSGSATFTNNTTIADGSVASLNYAWDFGDGGTSTATNPTHTYTTAGPFSVKLTATHSITGCTNNVVKQLTTVFPQPQALFAAPVEVCLGAPTQFIDGSTASGSTVTQWLWTFDDGTTSTLQNPSKTFATAGNHAVTLRVTSAVGCTSAVYSGSAVVNALPSANFAIAAPNCVAQAVTFTDASVANAGSITSWNWDLSDGAPFTNNSAAPFTHTYNTVGNYPVTLVVTTNKGCVASKTDTARVKELPLPGFAMPESCLSDPFSQFTNTSSMPDGSTGSTYLWNFGDVNATPANPNTSTVANPQHKFTQAGNYNVTLTITSVNGCSASVTQAFMVNGAVPESKFTILGTDRCSYDSITIQNNSLVDVGSIVKLEIFWDVSNPSLKTVDDNPLPGKTYRFKYPEFTTPATKAYTMRVVAYSGETCADPEVQTLTLNATPEVQLDPLPAVCANVAPFQLTQGSTANAAIVPGTGVYSGNGISATGLFSPVSMGIGTQTVRYTYTGSNGCVAFKEGHIKVFEVPTVNAGIDKNVLEGGSDTIRAVYTGSNLTYVWSPATWLSSSSVARPKVTPLGEQRYTITVTTGDGCVASDDVLVKFLKAPKIPNVFTPNGDGRNDRWEIMHLETYPGATIEIFNRYGQIVFRSIGYSKPWDGTFNGKDVPVGTYYYIINPKNGRQQMTGFVDLIR